MDKLTLIVLIGVVAFYGYRAARNANTLAPAHPRRRRQMASFLAVGSVLVFFALVSLADPNSDGGAAFIGLLVIAWAGFAWWLKRHAPSKEEVRAYELAHPPAAAPNPMPAVAPSAAQPVAPPQARPLPTGEARTRLAGTETSTSAAVLPAAAARSDGLSRS
jgi:hypothetical protein